MTFQRQPVRASTYLSVGFALAMGRSPGFGSTVCNLTPYSDSVSLRLRSFLGSLGSLHTVTPWLIRQKARRHPGHKSPELRPLCRLAVSGSISLPSPGFFSAFPHGTMCAIGLCGVFSLGGWSPQLPTGFPVPRGTREPAPRRLKGFAYGAITLYGPAFQQVQLPLSFVTPWGVCGLP